MTRVVDLHPEELLDRDARGELSAAEEARLESHLARCSACRLERQLRGDFADELASDVTPSSVERIALAGTSAPRVEPEIDVVRDALAPPSRASRSRWSSARGVRRASWLLVAAAVFAVSVAGATGAGKRAWSRLVGAPAPVAVEESAPTHGAAKHMSPHRAAPAPTVLAPVAEPSSTTDLLVTPPPVAPPAPPTTVARRRAPASETAASLFGAATEARRQGSYARAIDLQRELVSRYPRSREAHVAHETMGRLLLDRADPSGALESFDAYIGEGSGELGEEAMVGRATALERLGRSTQAADAWRTLLSAYPDTSYASHARARLGSSSVR